tara:strand:+ start:734 stop:2260 length:1527 start_codon:yes stop_codon:yes gene_type:complete
MSLFGLKNRAIRNKINLRSSLADTAIDNRSSRRVISRTPRRQQINQRRGGLSRLQKNSRYLQDLDTAQLNNQLAIEDRQFRKDQAGLAALRDQRNFDQRERSNDQSQANADRAFEQNRLLADRAYGLSLSADARANRADARAGQGQIFNQGMSLSADARANRADARAAQGQIFNQGMALSADQRANRAQDFSERNTLRNFAEDKFRYEQNRLDLENIAKIKNESEKAKALIKYADNLDAGYIENIASSSGFDITSFRDPETGDFTPEGERYLGTFRNFRGQGLSESEALSRTGAITLGERQDKLQNLIDELESAKISGKFSDGTDFNNEHNLELEDARKEIRKNSEELNRYDSNARNPEKTRLNREFNSNIEGAIQFGRGIAVNSPGDEPEEVTKARQGVELRKYLEDNGISINNIDKSSKKGKELHKMLEKNDPELIRLYENLQKAKGQNVISGSTANFAQMQPTSVGAGLVQSRARMSGITSSEKANAVKKAQQEYDKYFKSVRNR